MAGMACSRRCAVRSVVRGCWLPWRHVAGSRRPPPSCHVVGISSHEHGRDGGCSTPGVLILVIRSYPLGGCANLVESFGRFPQGLHTALVVRRVAVLKSSETSEINKTRWFAATRNAHPGSAQVRLCSRIKNGATSQSDTLRFHPCQKATR